MKRIPITPFLILAALFTVIGVSVYMEAEAEKRKQEELQRQQEEYLEKYEKAENAILMQDYNTAVELLENLPENFKDKEYVLVYAKYCKSVADGETIHTQYRITWELPHEGDMYTGDLVIVVLPINIRHAVNPLPTINCHRKKMNMMYMIMMIQRISIMIMKMILTNMEMRRITGMRLNKATSI